MARRFTSKAQWRAMFARKMPFARRWAHRNQRTAPYRSLPARKGRRTGRHN
ncbi:hypothetical protein GKJPGBOP_05869 [Streptomyces paromomycinus]|uniref:Uncharacterized protein n=1 Tax=Streptomyces paromomycinus TaxID=92743 RepID=A0A401WA04_STREY|nr:hypothetical protein GKJPGBOP_05869 [Streptomyces paromomycinus]